MQNRQRAPHAFLALLILLPGLSQAAPVTISDPVAPPFEIDGSGLCSASAVSSSPGVDFGFLTAETYNAGINAFIDAHRDSRFEHVIRTILDLSNNNPEGLQSSYGDFTDAMLPTCGTGGCGFFINDSTTSFGSRLRGYFNVTPDLANQPIHFGLYVDDAVSLTFFDRSASSHPVVIRAPQLGAATWRLTETVTFTQPGLYPLEILYVEIVEHAALELSYFIGPFEDFQRPANQAPVIRLSDAGFTLFAPSAFFQTLSGVPSFPDLDHCQQCDRQFVNLPGNNGCLPGSYCNEAALCAPCDTAQFCGPTCSPCGGVTPFCVNHNSQSQCVECREDRDCRPGFRCNPETFTCNECNTDEDCPRGTTCDENTCVPCGATDACAGSSCNCCPSGPGGQPMQCAALDQDSPPVCIECLTHADCPDSLCDVQIGRCVDTLATHQRPDCCGDECTACPSDHPYCLPGPLGTACAQCRWDTDCPDDRFCLSGQCLPCTRDRRCGPRCTSCGQDTPYCLDGQTADRSHCVACIDDTQCDGGTCNPVTNECEPTCTLSCPPETPYCRDQACVACVADTHCPCNGTCDLATGTCTSACKTNNDCQGVEHCDWNARGTARECTLGPMPSGVSCGGTLASTCRISAGAATGAPTGALLLALAMLMLLSARRRRGNP